MDRQRGGRGRGRGGEGQRSGRSRGRGGSDRTQKTEEFRNDVKSDLNPERPNRGRGRGGERGGFRGNRGRGGRQPNYRASRPRMVPTMDIKDIKLNEVQAAKIKELDDKIRELGKLTEPSHDEFEQKIQSINDQIAKIGNEIDNYNNQINDQFVQKDEFIKKNNPDFANMQTISEQLKELGTQRDAVKNEIKNLEDERSTITNKISKISENTGFRSVKEASERLESIEYQIETQTLSNNELKKLLGEQERLKKSFPALNEVEPLQQRKAEINEKLNTLKAQRHDIYERTSEFIEKRTSAREQKDAVTAGTTKFTDQIKVFKDKIKELRDKQKELYEEKNKQWNDFNKARDEYYDQLRQKRDLEYEKNTIYVEAERIMSQIEEGQKKIGEIKEKVNPHAEDIKIAGRLVLFLENQLDKESEKSEETKPVHGKATDDATSKLIQSCHALKGKKNKKKAGNQTKEKAKSGINYSLEDINDLNTLNVKCPQKIEEIPETLQILRSKISQWYASFVKAEVNLNVNEDGSIAVRIRIP